MNLFKRFGEKLSQDTDQLRAQQIRRLCSELKGIQQIAESRPRTRPRVAGIVQSIKVIPRQETSLLEVEVYDGSDSLVAVWWGRREIPGVTLGQPLILCGTLIRSDNGAAQMINPEYELVAADRLV
jgi:RecG-like helicase